MDYENARTRPDCLLSCAAIKAGLVFVNNRCGISKQRQKSAKTALGLTFCVLGNNFLLLSHGDLVQRMSVLGRHNLPVFKVKNAWISRSTIRMQMGQLVISAPQFVAKKDKAACGCRDHEFFVNTLKFLTQVTNYAGK